MIEDERIANICSYPANRAPARFLVACLLAKIHKPAVDIRKPYTEIGDKDSYSGRSYDEKYVQSLIMEYGLPLNPTTAFLTPAFRTFNQPIYAQTKLSGKPKRLYDDLISLLQDIQDEVHSAEDYLKEVLRLLIQIREEQRQSIEERSEHLRGKVRDLSAHKIIQIVSEHLRMRRASRLPVLVIAAIYDTAQESLAKRYTTLSPHTAADKPSGTLGDLEIVVPNSERPYIVYEVKHRTLSQGDIDIAVRKLRERSEQGESPVVYAYVSTKPIPQEVKEYTESLNREDLSSEFQLFDCLDFLRHFLHLFHEKREQFLEKYKQLVLNDRTVDNVLKEKLLELIEIELEPIVSAEGS